MVTANKVLWQAHDGTIKMNRLHAAAITGIGCLVLLAPATKGESPAYEGSDWAAWTVKVEPLVWAPALRGDFRLPGGGRIDVEDVDADENEIVPAGVATVRADKWSFLFRGFGFSLDERPVKIDLAGFDLTAGYNIWTPINDDANHVRLALDLCAGLRVHSLDLSLGDDQDDNTWAEPIGGVRIGLDLPRGFGLGISIDGGGFSTGDDSSFSWDITVAFSWMPSRHLGVEIGFRHLQMDLSKGKGNDEFEFDAALAGLFGGVVIRF